MGEATSFTWTITPFESCCVCDPSVSSGSYHSDSRVCLMNVATMMREILDRLDTQGKT